jgi:serine/threonine protein kinase
MQDKKYRYGITGFVALEDDVAKKFININSLIWLREYIALTNLCKYDHDNIIKYKRVYHEESAYPKIANKLIRKKLDLDERIRNANLSESNKKMYCVFEFKKEVGTIKDLTINNDVELIQILIDILSAVEFCHRLNIWHRDIKPDNILYTQERRAVLIDFSHSVKINNYNIQGLDSYVSTFSYRAPEVFAYKKNRKVAYNEKIDIWSVGMILWDMLTDQRVINLIENDTEAEMERVFSDEEDYYMMLLYDMFKIYKKKYLQNNAVYWGWLCKMLKKDFNERISAREMLDEVITFANENKIPYQLRHVDIEKTEKVNLPIGLDAKHIELYNIASHWTYKYSDLLKSVVPFDSMNRFLQLLIKNGDITEDNVKTYVKSVIIMMNVILFERIYELADTENAEIALTIMDLVSKYHNEIFL